MKSTKFEYALYQIPPRQGGESETFFQCRRLAELNIYGAWPSDGIGNKRERKTAHE